MRRFEDGCVGCGKHPCFNCEEEHIDCDGCGREDIDADDDVYCLPDDSERDYCLSCLKSFLELLPVPEDKTCPECHAEDIESLYRYADVVVCDECLDEVFKRRDI